MDALVMTRLEEITKHLKESNSELKELKSEVKDLKSELNGLKSECSIIKKEILGIGVANTSNCQEMGLLEDKTLRQIVEETQFQVNKINERMLDNEIQEQMVETTKSKGKMKPNEGEKYYEESLEEITGSEIIRNTKRTKSNNKSGLNLIVAEGRRPEESFEEFLVVEIQRKSMAQERNWMKNTFREIKKTATFQDGDSLRGRTLKAVSFSMEFSDQVQSLCTMKLSNYLDSALTDPQYHVFSGSRNSGPSRVLGHYQEVISFMGLWRCHFMCSFAISQFVRLTIRCYNDTSGDILFGIGFTPANVPLDQTLYNKLCEMPQVPDVWMIEKGSKIPQERFVSHGKFLVRGYMSRGPCSLVYVEILERNHEDISANSSENKTKKNIADGKSIKSHTSFQNSGTISRVPIIHGDFSCNIEIVNCLSVTLRNRGKFYCSCEKNDFMPLEVFPFQRERFFGADKARSVEAMFSYDIDATDFAIVVAVKVEIGLNSFAAAFVELPADTGAKEFEDLIDPNQWRTHEYRKYAYASDGVQLIQIGNIRAEMLMTEEEQSIFKIRIFAI